MSKRKKERAARVSWAQQMKDQVFDLMLELGRQRRVNHDAFVAAFRAARAADLPVVSGNEFGIVNMPGLGIDRDRDTLFLYASATPDISVPTIERTMNVVAIKRKVLMARLPCGIILRWVVPDEESLK